MLYAFSAVWFDRAQGSEEPDEMVRVLEAAVQRRLSSGDGLLSPQLASGDPGRLGLRKRLHRGRGAVRLRSASGAVMAIDF